MQFLRPEFLYGLLLLAIPIIIHLFQLRRYKTLPFSDIRFVKNLKNQSRRQRKVRDLLVLLSRILALAFLVFAFARPILPLGDNQQAENEPILLAIDNGYTSVTQNQRGVIIDQIRATATKFLDPLPSHTEVELYTASQPFHGAFALTVSDAKTEISRMEPYFQPFPIADIRSKIKKKGYRGPLWVISDFSSLPDVEWAEIADSTLPTRALPVQPPLTTQQVNVDSVWFQNPVFLPASSTVLYFVLSRAEAEDSLSVMLNLFEEEQQRGLVKAVFPAGAKKVTGQMPVAYNGPGWKKSRLSIGDNAPSDYFFTYQVNEDFNLVYLHTAEPKREITRFLGEPHINATVQGLQSPDLTAISQAQLIVCEAAELPSGVAQALRSAVENGSNLLVIHPTEASTYNAFFSSLQVGIRAESMTDDTVKMPVLSINFDDPYWAGAFMQKNERADLPHLTKYFFLSGKGAFTPATLQSQKPLLLRQNLKKGWVVALAASPEKGWGTLGEHALWLPVLFQGMYAQTGLQVFAHVQGSDSEVFIPIREDLDTESVLSLTSADTEPVIPAQFRTNGGIRLDLSNMSLNPGVYSLHTKEKTVGYFGVNQIQPVQNLEARKILEEGKNPWLTKFEGNLESLFTKAGELKTHTPLWKYCVIFAVTFVLAESLLIRYRKKTST